HLAGDWNLIDRECVTPADCDHRTWRILDGESVEIFTPANVREEICEPRETAVQRPPEPEIPLQPIPRAQPDAGLVDSMAEDAGVEVLPEDDAGAPPPIPTPTNRPHRPRDPEPVVPPTTPTQPTPPPTQQPVVPL
ncbi:MAG: hypothetical protein KJ732_04040, partial [Candidatus Margulisbacteria bacterium]|nr:hypothetical protein [Candidatus Margulisiibacteriota bacterium]